MLKAAFGKKCTYEDVVMKKQCGRCSCTYGYDMQRYHSKHEDAVEVAVLAPLCGRHLSRPDLPPPTQLRIVQTADED